MIWISFLQKSKGYFHIVLSKLIVKDSTTKELLSKSNVIMWLGFAEDDSIFLSYQAAMQLLGNVVYVLLKTSGILQFFKENTLFSVLQNSWLELLIVFTCCCSNYCIELLLDVICVSFW